MVFIETSIFTELITEILSDDSYADFQQMLAINPEQGDMIPGSGGLRKIRWRQQNTSKRGGIRIIYYFRVREDQIILIYAYKKTSMENLTPKQLQQLKKIVEEWK